MSRPAMLRAVAERLMNWAERLLPQQRKPWAAAMRAELQHIDRDRDAVAWAFGCFLASLKSRVQEIIVKRDLLTSFAIAFAFGAGIWALSPSVTGHAEPWDADSSYYLAALFITGLIVGWICPRKIWPALPGVAIGQFAYMLLFLPKGPLIAVGLITLFVYGSVALGAAFVGSRLRRVVRRDDPFSG
jgi:hypothetical protein